MFQLWPNRDFATNCPQMRDQNTNRPVIHQRGRGAQQQQGRAVAHATTSKQADAPNVVVTGTLPIFGHLAFVLFDSGSTHSFVSEEFIDLALLEKEPLEIILSVSTPAHELLMATHRVKEDSVTVRGRVIEATLIVLSMQDFDVIFCMNWLGENRALINCETRIVTLRLPLGDSFTYKGATSKRTPRVITARKARKMIRSGAIAFLASVTLDSRNEQTVSSVHIVRDFVDVLEDLPSLPPVRKVDFEIDLQPGTVPISKAPYRMAPAELRELKE